MILSAKNINAYAKIITLHKDRLHFKLLALNASGCNLLIMKIHPGPISIPNFSADNLIKAAICELIIIFHCPASCAHQCCGGEKEHTSHTPGSLIIWWWAEAPSELERERYAHTHQHRSLALGGCIISYWIIDRVWVSVISEFHLPALNEQARKAFNQVEPPMPIHNTMRNEVGVILFLDDDRRHVHRALMRKYPTGIFIYFAPLLTLINELPVD